MEKNNSSNLINDFEAILGDVYAKKQKQKVESSWSKKLGHPLNVITAISIRPEKNLGAFVFDVAESVQSLPPAILHSSDQNEIFTSGLKWLVEDYLPNERLDIWLPITSLENVKLPVSDRIRFRKWPSDDSVIMEMSARGDRHISNYLRHCAGEVVESIKLPDCPAIDQNHAAWGLYCWEECMAAGLDDAEANHEILKKMSRPFTEEEIAIVTRKMATDRRA